MWIMKNTEGALHQVQAKPARSGFIIDCTVCSGAHTTILVSRIYFQIFMKTNIEGIQMKRNKPRPKKSISLMTFNKKKPDHILSLYSSPCCVSLRHVKGRLCSYNFSDKRLSTHRGQHSSEASPTI